MSDGVMTYEDWLRGCVYHDGRHGYVTLPCDEVLKIADFIERLRADRKDECKWYGDKQVCGRCRSRNLYAPKDEPQDWKDQMWTEAVEDEQTDIHGLTDCDFCKGKERNCEDCEGGKDEPQTEENWYDWRDEQDYRDRWDIDEPQTEDEMFREQCRAFMGIVKQMEREDE